MIRNFKDMINEFKVNEDVTQISSTKAKKLIKKIKKEFEENMNNDLHVKSAFDSLYKTVSSLVKINKRHMLSTEDSKKILAELKDIDYVLQVFF